MADVVNCGYLKFSPVTLILVSQTQSLQTFPLVIILGKIREEKDYRKEGEKKDWKIETNGVTGVMKYPSVRKKTQWDIHFNSVGNNVCGLILESRKGATFKGYL